MANVMNKNHTNKLKWCSIAIYNTQVEEILVEIIIPFISKYDSAINCFWFNRSTERGDNLILLFKMKPNAADEYISNQLRGIITQKIKEKPGKRNQSALSTQDWFLPFPENHIEYNNKFLFDIIETGGLKASNIAEKLFQKSSELILKIFSNQKYWIPEDEIAKIFQFHLTLSSSFFTLKELVAFYSKIFESIKARLNIEEQDIKELINGLEDNFHDQKAMIVDYINTLLSSLLEGDLFENDILNEWKNSCESSKEELFSLQRNNEFFAPEDFEQERSINIPLNKQELFPIIEYYIRSINSQFGVKNSIELNVIYVLKRSLETIQKK